MQALQGFVGELRERNLWRPQLEPLREEFPEFVAAQHTTTPCVRRALPRLASSKARDEHTPVARLAERQRELAQAPIEPSGFENAKHRPQAANADAQLVQVLGI